MLYTFQQGLLNMPPKRDPERRLLLLPTEEIRLSKGRLRKNVDRAALSELHDDLPQGNASVSLVQRPALFRLLADRKSGSRKRRKGDGRWPLVIS